LDHSIHTFRLWGNTKAKELCSEWNMNMFFRLIHNDMGGLCLERLNEVRAPGKLQFSDAAGFAFSLRVFALHKHLHK
jgi:Coiled-coil protein 142